MIVSDPCSPRAVGFEKYYPVFEMVDVFLYSSPETTHTAPHVRDGIDLKRLMMYVVVALIPCILWSWFNTGYQANLALAKLGMAKAGWRYELLATLNIGFDAGSILANTAHGFLYFLPIYLTTLIVGGVWETVFATVHQKEINEGFLVTSMLFTLTLPPNMPLWMVAIGMSFGVVIGKEIFGGTGKNFLNPALTGRAFLFFAYTAEISGDRVWVAVDGYSGATALSLGKVGGVEEIIRGGTTSVQCSMGLVPGSLGETSTLACLIGAVFLIYTRVGSWRIILRGLFGYGRGLAPVQCGRQRHQSHGGDALVLAPGSGRVCLRHGVHGHRPGVSRDDDYRALGLRHSDRGHDRADPRGEPSVS